LAVAVDGGLVVGFVSADHSVHPDKPLPELWINEVSVAATHWGRGLGTRLLRSLFDVTRALGCAEGRGGRGHGRLRMSGLTECLPGRPAPRPPTPTREGPRCKAPAVNREAAGQAFRESIARRRTARVS
jgi:GNAT superfamily N-acetyltransferase